MPTIIEYRMRAKQFLELAKESQDLYAQVALAELAEEFNKVAEKLERHPRPSPHRH
jgi:hypothetical protein